MIDVATDTGVTVVTIKNYDRYQHSATKIDVAIDASADTSSTQHRRKEEEKEERKEIDGGGERMPECLISPEATSLASEVASLCGLNDPKNWPPGWCGAPLRVRSWLGQPRWTPEIILAVCREVMGKKRDGPPDTINYFEKAIARAVAKQAAPLPHIEESNVQAIGQNQPAQQRRGFGFASIGAQLRARQSAG
jgi:hypothetical protein